MAVDMNQMAAQDADFMKQAAATRQADADKQTQTAPSFLQKWVTGPVGRVTTSMIDGAVSGAEQIYDTPGMRKARDAVSGAITGATNIDDSAQSAATAVTDSAAESRDPMTQVTGMAGQALMHTVHPIWDYAKQHILDFRDAVSVQDPTLSDNLVQGVAQLAIPFAGYSRALAGVGGIANAVASGALTDATALQPHDARLADLIALGRHTEGKLGDALRTLAPDGSAFNAYVNYLGDRTDETEAEGRFKNVLDGFGANLIATPLMHGAAVALKQGTSALRYAAENFGTGPVAGGMRAQEGKIGYHGSPQTGIAELQPGEKLSARGHGIYLSEDPSVANSYVPSAGGSLYKVDVPDEHIAGMLHWDKPLSQQPIAAHAFNQHGISGDLTAGEAYRQLSQKLAAANDGQFSGQGDKAASEALSSAGVPGIQYPSSGKYSTRGATGNNLVVFDPKNVKVVGEKPRA